MEQYNVTGMSCAACQARVEKAVSNVDGVTSCSVNLLTNTMGVEGNADSAAIIKAVTDAGYGASKRKTSKYKVAKTVDRDVLSDTQTPLLKWRLIASVIMLVPLMYISMGSMMLGWPIPLALEHNHLALGICQMLLCTMIMVINQKYFINGLKGVIHKTPNMDTLVAMGAGASFIYSISALFKMTFAVTNMDYDAVMALMDDFYFESTGTILTLITVGKTLEAKSKGKTIDALKGLMKLVPETATIIKDGTETTIYIEQIKIGDRIAVKPGESIPVDGFVIEGKTAVDESALTGESVPVDKKPGDKIYGATINQSGYILCEASSVGADTTISKIIQLVSDAAATKAPIAKIADRVSGVFVPVVLVISCLTFIAWMLAGQDIGYALSRAISVLVISCPCALGLATPVAIMVGSGIGAKNGILFKTALSLEETGKIEIVVLDKTGTITKGEPNVTEVYPAVGIKEEELLKIAYSLEAKSEHPLAGAIVRYAKKKGISSYSVEDFKVMAGNGISGKINNEVFITGKFEFIKDKVTIIKADKEIADGLSKEGMTPLYFAKEGKFIGIIAVADIIKEDSKNAVMKLRNMGIRVAMLTGDNELTANAIGRQVGVDEVIAGVLPDGKQEVINRLKHEGKVAMVGDGINDAPALISADIGIAIGAGTDVAIDAADVVLMKNSIIDVASSINMSRATLRNIHENLFWAFFYNVIGIPLAAGAWIPMLGWTLNPMFAAAAMSLSSFCVVSNALRLNLFKYDYNRKINRKQIMKKKEDKEAIMEITVKGMMCAHCEAHTKEAIEKIDGVISATADHKKESVSIKTSKDISEADIKAAVESAGYEFVEIK